MERKHHLFNIPLPSHLRRGTHLFSSGRRERNRILCINSISVMMWRVYMKCVSTARTARAEFVSGACRAFPAATGGRCKSVRQYKQHPVQIFLYFISAERERSVSFLPASSFPHDNLSNFSLFLSFLPFFVTYFLVTTFYYTSLIPNFPSSFSDSLPSFLPCLLLLFVMTQNTFSHSVFSRPLLLLTSSSSFCPD